MNAPTADSEIPLPTSRRFPLLELLLLLSAQALFFQAIPAAWTRFADAVRWFAALIGTILSPIWRIVDVRNWNVTGYIVALAVVLTILVGLKVWKDRLEGQESDRRWSSNRKRM
jgi:hypothetical protein